MNDPDGDRGDPASPKVQRRMWRRVWIGVVVFVLLVPILVWVAVDQSGKAEWREVKARLQAKGEATSFEELGLRVRGEIADEDNFCSLPWLVANEDGTEGDAMIELGEKLAIFGGSRAEPELLSEARGRPLLGYSGNLSERAQVMDLIADEEGVEIDETMMEEAGDDPMARIVTHLNATESYWAEAERTLERPQAYFLPLYEQRLEAVDGAVYSVGFPNLSTSQSVVRVMAVRASIAMQRGDHETALRSLLIAQRLGQAATNEMILIGGLVAHTHFTVMLDPVVECLWDESFRSDPENLRRLQEILEDWDLDKVVAVTARGELAYSIEGMQKLSQDSVESIKMLGLPTAVAFAPSGWWSANVAYQADLLDRTVLDAIRSGSHSDLRAAAERMSTELKSLGRVERIYRFMAVSNMYSYQTIIERFSYSESLRRQAIIVCALHRHRLDHNGEFPGDLDALVPTYLKQVPGDPIDGAPMRYSVPGVGSAAFELYSIGNDGTDDGGELVLDADEPVRRTRPHKSDYLGDWPWPVEPRELPVKGGK